jgi:hypothetical protein
MLRAFTSSVAKSISHTLFQKQPSLACAAAGLLQHSHLLHSTVTRDPAYSKHNEDDVEFFQNVLGGRGVVEDAAALEPMNRCGVTARLGKPFAHVPTQSRCIAASALGMGIVSRVARQQWRQQHHRCNVFWSSVCRAGVVIK